ncbi:hypothetical protein Salat_2507100 [Sesamum alatum]|uniref:Uncharacterized protein n=1 Tax=Sesamum alatum TaxID=300844 RepID=A0AAE1XRV2_9LAMI|nr:hypothetical protein Salat_2507100 [Sesamum alatum]
MTAPQLAGGGGGGAAAIVSRGGRLLDELYAVGDGFAVVRIGSGTVIVIRGLSRRGSTGVGGAFGESGEHDEAENGVAEAVEQRHRREAAGGLPGGPEAAAGGHTEWVLEHVLLELCLRKRESL